MLNKIAQIFYLSGKSLASIIRIILFSKPFIRYSKVERHSDECVILGNGPSLKGFLENNVEFLDGKDSFCVNLFARSSSYKQIKPTHYVITAPQYWKGEKQVEYIENRTKTLEAIVARTNWPMTFFAPSFARKHKSWLERFSSNESISVKYFNSTAVEGFKCFREILFSLNLGLPRPHNVLISSIYVAIQSGYKKIYVTGADHSWLKEIHVTKDNIALVGQKHFYDKEFKNDPLNNSDPKPLAHRGEYTSKKIHQILDKFKTAFESHYILSQYAKSKQVEIINITEGSFIDSYPRKLL